MPIHPKNIYNIGCIQIQSRIQEGEQSEPFQVSYPEDILKFWEETIENQEWYNPQKEQIINLLLNSKLQIKAWDLVSIGNLTEAILHPREVFRPAILAAARYILLIHNHPSGDPYPSNADISVTQRTMKAGELLQIPLKDHIIIGTPESNRKKYHSLREQGIV